MRIPMSWKDRFAFDFEKIARHTSKRTKILVLSTPTNPTGHVLEESDIQHMVDLLHRHNLWLISDESYEKIIFDDHQHISPAGYPAIADRTVTIHSFTKSYSLGNWRIGYLVGRQSLVKVARNVLEWQVLRCAIAASGKC